MEIQKYRLASGKRGRSGGYNGDPLTAIIIVVIAMVCYFIGTFLNG